MRAIALTSLVLVLASVSAVRAEDQGDPLLEAARSCPLSLRKAMHITYADGRRPLDAELVLDTAGRLMIRATVHVPEGDEATFERWTGHVHGGGWVPTRETLTGTAAEVASRRLAHLGQDRERLHWALDGAIGTEERPGPADLALAVRPVDEDRPGVLLRVAEGGTIRGLRFERGEVAFTVVDAPASPSPAPYTAPTMPAFDVVEDGTWFNTDEPPTLEGLRGRPVLIVITDPG